MKQFVLTFTCVLAAAISYGQSLFFDSMTNSVWATSPVRIDSVLIAAEEITLVKFIFPVDSLKDDFAVWRFNEGNLTITYYDLESRTENILAVYGYELETETNRLKIIIGDNELWYKAGITSTGTYALLMRVKTGKN